MVKDWTLTLETRQGLLLSLPHVNVIWEVLANALRREKEKIGSKGRNKTVCRRWYYVEKPKESTKKLVELISEFIEVPGNKVNIQQSLY